MKETKEEEREGFDYLKKMMGTVLILTAIGIGLYFALQSLKVDCEVNPPMEFYCLTYNIEEMEGCIREGYTGTGFLGMRDFNNEYWTCEDYGRVVKSCIDWSEPSPSNWTKDWENCK